MTAEEECLAEIARIEPMLKDGIFIHVYEAACGFGMGERCYVIYDNIGSLDVFMNPENISKMYLR